MRTTPTAGVLSAIAAVESPTAAAAVAHGITLVETWFEAI